MEIDGNGPQLQVNHSSFVPTMVLQPIYWIATGTISRLEDISVSHIVTSIALWSFCFSYNLHLCFTYKCACMYVCGINVFGAVLNVMLNVHDDKNKSERHFPLRDLPDSVCTQADAIWVLLISVTMTLLNLLHSYSSWWADGRKLLNWMKSWITV